MRPRFYKTQWLRWRVLMVKTCRGGRQLYVEGFGYGLLLSFPKRASPPTKAESAAIARLQQQGRSEGEAAQLVYGVTRGR